MPVLTHAYAPISSPGQNSGLEQEPRPMPSSSEFQSLVGLLNTVATDIKAARNDASLCSAEMYEILSDVEGKMLQGESHFMSEIQARNAQQQAVMQAYQESLRAQVTQQQTIMQAQVTQQREEIRSMERRLKDEFFLRIESIAEAIRRASVVTSIESGVNECMHGMNDASELFVPRVVGSLRSAEVSTAPLVAENPVGVDVTTPVVDNTYSTQPPPHNGRGSWVSERAAIVGTLGLDESSVERRQLESGTRASVYVMCNEGPQEQEEEEAKMRLTGKTVPHVVPNGDRSSDSQLLSRVNVCIDENRETFVASMEHDDDNSWNCRSDSLPPRVCITGRTELPLTVRGNECIIRRTELPLTASGGAHNSSTLDQTMTAGSATQFAAQQYTQSYSSSSSQRQNLSDNEPVVRSQFDSPSVCTHRDLQYYNDDDDRSDRTFTRQTAARIRGHSPGRSHSQPPPSQHARELGPVPTTCSLMTENTAAVQSVECRTVQHHQKHVTPP